MLINHAVYKAAVLATLLYGSECCWAVKANQIHCLEVFHYHCVRCILEVTCYQQWTGHVSNNTLLREFKMSDSLKCMLMERHMRWIGHVCRMDVSRQPKKLLFGELMKSNPFHATKQHWRDVVSADLKTLDAPLNDWYDLTMNRWEW